MYLEKELETCVSNFVSDYVHYFSDFIMNLRRKMVWYDVDDFTEVINFCKEFSLFFEEKTNFFTSFMTLLHDKMTMSYISGVNESLKEIEEIFGKTVQPELDSMNFSNYNFNRYKKQILLVLRKFYDNIHDSTIDCIIGGSPAENILQLFSVGDSNKTMNIILDMIRFSIKETFNMAKVMTYRHAGTGWYRIKPDEEEKDGCNEVFFTVLPVDKDRVIFPPFEPSCTCKVALDEDVLIMIEKEKSEGRIVLCQ